MDINLKTSQFKIIFLATTDAAEPTPTTVTVPDVRVRIQGKTVKCEFVLVLLFDNVDIRYSSI